MTEPFWLSRQAIEIIHDEQLAEHGGAGGIRDAGLLESALTRPRITIPIVPGFANVPRYAWVMMAIMRPSVLYRCT